MPISLPKILRRLGLAAAGLAVLGVLLLGAALGPSLLVGAQYERLSHVEPRTRASVEAALFPLVVRHTVITKEQSDWGRNLSLSGQYERYSVLGEPIDVVYAGDRVLAILPSYE